MHVGKCDVLDISFRLLKVICSGFLDDEACLESEDAAGIKSKENILVQNLVYELCCSGAIVTSKVLYNKLHCINCF